MILGEIADKINELRMHTINVCKAMQRVKTELSGIKNLDKFDINLIGEKFNFDKNYLIKMKSELTFLREGFIKYYFNIGNDQTPFLLKASQKNKIGNDQDPFIHLIPLDQKLKEEITECTYYIYQELIAYQNEKVHNKVLRSISPLKRIIKINAQDEAKNLGERDESDNKRSMNEHIFNKMNVIMNKDIGIKNHVNMSEDNINNKFNTLQLSQFSKNNKIINNNSNFRKFDLINNNKSEENNNKIMNDLSNKNQEPKEDIKYIKNIFTDKEKIISKSSSSTIRINQEEKRRTISENMGDKNNNDNRNIFMKYKINEKEKNNELPQFKSKSISQINNVNSNNVLPENNKKEEENKMESSGYDEFAS